MTEEAVAYINFFLGVSEVGGSLQAMDWFWFGWVDQVMMVAASEPTS